MKYVTERQLEVTRLVAEGLSHEEIAAQLGISARTAKAHTDALRQKFGVSRVRKLPHIVFAAIESGEAKVTPGAPSGRGA